jgi:hypothetical protein
MFPPFKSQVARAIPFDNTGNGFTATECQAAIVEASRKARASITTTFDGNIGNNQWLGYTHLIPGDTVPIRIPWNCTLLEITMSWVGAAVDGSFVLYKNGIGPGNIINTQVFTNQNGGANLTPNLSFVAGDLLRGRWVDSGDNPSDLAIVYFFLLT